jgi:uncharacterized membrane protein
MMLVVIMAFVLNGFMAMFNDLRITEAIFRSFHISFIDNFFDSVQSSYESIKASTNIGSESSEGLIHSIYKGLHINNGNAGFTMLSTLNNIFLSNRISPKIIAILADVILIFFAIFVKYILLVGRMRFFLENRLYTNTPIRNAFFIYWTYAVFSTVKTLFYKMFLILVWLPTIVMVPVKLYEYSLTECLLAENPKLGAKNACLLSKKMSKGYKWKLFLLDLTFLPWHLLGLLTFGITRYTYSDIYYYATKAEIYAEIRDAFITNIKNFHFLENFVLDFHLFEKENLASDIEQEQEAEVYPWGKYILRQRPAIRVARYNYLRQYSIENIILIFWLFSFMGWILEVFWAAVVTGQFVNRGSLYGPWIPIYGTGGVAIVLLLKQIAHKPIVTFFLTLLISGVIEYTAATITKNIEGISYWSYKGYFLNIEGKISLEGLLTFGILGVSSIYLFAPMSDYYLNKISKQTRYLLASFFILAFGFDNIYAHFHPHTGFDITTPPIGKN